MKPPTLKNNKITETHNGQRQVGSTAEIFSFCGVISTMLLL